MNALVKLTAAKDFVSDQEVRWCPGCGDYSILKVGAEDTGADRRRPEPRRCSSPVSGARAGFRITSKPTASTRSTAARRRSPPASSSPTRSSTSGSSPATATGCRSAATTCCTLLRRNLDCQVLLFNNEIYGLTKGQYSPTSRSGTRSPSTPFGSVDRPISPCGFALGAGARFIARSSMWLRPRPPTFCSGLTSTKAQASSRSSELHRLQRCGV